MHVKYKWFFKAISIPSKFVFAGAEKVVDKRRKAARRRNMAQIFMSKNLETNLRDRVSKSIKMLIYI